MLVLLQLYVRCPPLGLDTATYSWKLSVYKPCYCARTWSSYSGVPCQLYKRGSRTARFKPRVWLVSWREDSAEIVNITVAFNLEVIPGLVSHVYCLESYPCQEGLQQCKKHSIDLSGRNCFTATVCTGTYSAIHSMFRKRSS